MDMCNALPDTFFSTLDNICVSLLLGVLGIAITIFTVVYSFMESNKQVIRALTDKITTSENEDPVTRSDLFFAKKYMQRMKRMNKYLIAIIVIDINLFVLLCVNLASNGHFLLRILTYCSTFLLMLFCLFVLSVYIRQYTNRYTNT